MTAALIALAAVVALLAAGVLRGVRGAAKLGLLALIVSFPYLPFVPFSLLGSVNTSARYALVAVSLVVLTGWVGQISLGHAGLVGVGAYVTGLVTGSWNIGFPVSLLWGAVAGALVAAALGVAALRVRGLYLAVATLMFAWVADAFLFRQPWFTRHASIEVGAVGRPHSIPYFAWGEREIFYYGAWATVIITLFLLSNLRDSKTGRSFFAVRGSEVAAASLGIDVMRTKLVAFAISGFVAGAAGALNLVQNQTVSPENFKVDQSLFFLSIAVVAGLTSLGGCVAAGLLFGFLEEAFFQVEALGGYLTVVSAALLALVLLLYRGGLAAVPAGLAPRVAPLWARIRPAIDGADRFLADVRRRLPRRPVTLSRTDRPAPATPEPAGPMGPAAGAPADPGSARNGSGDERIATPALLDARDVTVRFGGLTAVDNASLEVREGEIVGLIGPNGAGKTTLFNAIAGLNVPTGGTINIMGTDATRLPVHRRAQLGVGRTFQAIQLFGPLTVFDNLLVATHLQNRTGLFSHLGVTSASLRAEHQSRQQVAAVIEQLGLGEVAERPARDLPFGVLRMVEVARALVTDPKLIMLDEPASGLDNTETDRLADLIGLIRSLGVTILLIEHDVRMVTAVTDYVYVLQRGSIIADGPPARVARDPIVIEAYLGRSHAGEELEAEETVV